MALHPKNLFIPLLFLSAAAAAQPCTQQVIATYSPQPLCAGNNLQLSASTVTGATYSWAGPSFSSGLQNPVINAISVAQSGDYIVTATEGSCIYKDTVTVVVNPLVIPTVSIQVLDSNRGPHFAYLYTSSVTNGGSVPTYQWRKNNVDIPGATASNYTAVTSVDIQHGDLITLRVTADATEPCPGSANSNTLMVKINLGVKELSYHPDIELYPNPNNGTFRLYLPPSATGENALIEIYNTLGQVMHREITQRVAAKPLEKQIVTDMATGVYLLRIREQGATHNMWFTVK